MSATEKQVRLAAQLYQARDALAYLQQYAAGHRQSHIYSGDCPDASQPTSRDRGCPACNAMVMAADTIAAIDALPAPSGEPADDLAAQIMNIQCRSAEDIGREHEHSSVVYAYKCGHRDARHAAAELVGSTTAPAPLPAEWRKAVQEAYGWLWHVNQEPMAPIPMWEPEKAAYQARKCLRELLTTGERGEAINAIAAHIDKVAASDGATPLLSNGLTAAETSATASVAIIDSPETGYPSRVIDGQHVPCAHDGRVHPDVMPATASVAGLQPVAVFINMNEGISGSRPSWLSVDDMGTKPSSTWARYALWPIGAAPQAAPAPQAEPVCKHHNGQFCGKPGPCLSPHCKPAHPAPAVAATVPAVQALTDAACQWGQEDEGSGTYWSACGHGFTFNDGGPTDNGLKHCCYCGKPLIELPWVEPEPDAGIATPAAPKGQQ